VSFWSEKKILISPYPRQTIEKKMAKLVFCPLTFLTPILIWMKNKPYKLTLTHARV